MMQFVIAAPRSGSGKTTVTCAMLAALKKRGMDPCAFKSGPDYIDPMFHRSVLGVESHNLDLYLSAKNTVRELYAYYAAGHGAVVCEGAMGFYDGQGLTTRASAWELADALDLPVLLVVQPKGASVTLAAEIQGLVHFKPESHIAGILLNDCSEKLFRMLKPLLETETGLPVLGYLPRLPQAVVKSRHLGLKTAGEITDLAQKIGLLADALEANLDWATLEALTERPAPAPVPPPALQTAGVRIAVAQDEAFCFAYAETLDCLRTAGAELVFFSPVHDTTLPEDICGLYLPGGYPELYARPLSENNHARCHPGCRKWRPAHGGRVRRLSVSGADAGRCQRYRLAHGRRSARQRRQGGAAGAVRLCRHDRQSRQPAVPCRRAFAYSRIPPLGFHRQWYGLFRLEKRKSTVGMRICKHEFVRRFPASLLGRHSPAPPLCERCKVLSTTKEKHT